jgi:hypothetical protein
MLGIITAKLPWWNKRSPKMITYLLIINSRENDTIQIIKNLTNISHRPKVTHGVTIHIRILSIHETHRNTPLPGA